MAQSELTSAANAVKQDADALEALVAQAKAGDHIAFEHVYEWCKQPIWNYLFYLLQDRESAYDLFQETFLRAWKKLPTLEKHDQFEAWLKQIAIHIAFDYLRREKKITFLSFSEQQEDEPTTPFVSRSAGFEEQVAEKDCLERALAEMSPRNRLCLLLHDQWGFTQREIASLLGISEKGVSAYMSRGREQFRQLYLQTKSSVREE